MVRNFAKRWPVVQLGVLSALALVLLGRWLNANKIGGQGPAEPFRIAGNLYYVGASDVAAFLITDLERSFRVLRSLPADIWVTAHARQWGRYRKFVASATAKNPADAFIDPEGYRAYVDTAEAELRQGVVH